MESKIDYHEHLLRPHLSDEAMHNSVQAWIELEQQYGIRFLLKDGTFRPVNEWLDDLYIRFSTIQAMFVVEQIMLNGDVLFADIKKHRE